MSSFNVDDLFCEEEIGEFSPEKDDAGSAFESSQEVIDVSLEFVRTLLANEQNFMPGDEYFTRLQSNDLCVARCRVVQWMLKASGHFNFSPHTLSSAVNCLDRFLARSLDKPGKELMIDLLGVGCLSVAAKQDENGVPRLKDLQVQGLEHKFDSTTLKHMELTILNTLEWRLRSVTAFSYTDEVLQQLVIAPAFKAALHARVTELLLPTLSEAQFVEYRPSIIAHSSILRALQELLPTQAQLLKINLLNIIPVDKRQLERCYEIMGKMAVQQSSTTPSNSKSFPASAIAASATETGDSRNKRKRIS